MIMTLLLMIGKLLMNKPIYNDWILNQLTITFFLFFFSPSFFFRFFFSIIRIVISYIRIVFGIRSILILWILVGICTFSWTKTIWYLKILWTNTIRFSVFDNYSWTNTIRYSVFKSSSWTNIFGIRSNSLFGATLQCRTSKLLFWCG